MNSTQDITKSYLASSSLLGIARGIIVHTLIYPLEVIKTYQQSQSNCTKSYEIAGHLWRTKGWTTFYRGLLPQLIKTCMKQAFCWPMIAGLPRLFERYGVQHTLQQQAMTGISIATIDATITTPLERTKILLILRRKISFSLKSIYQQGWYGLTFHWMKLSVNWSTFLVAQKYFRDQFQERSGKQQLSLMQLTEIGARVALVVSLVSAPFDVAHTIKQSQQLQVSYLLSGNVLRKMYRGWPINTISLLIHNIASIIVLDQLGRMNKN